MEPPKLIIKPKRFDGESAIVSIRIPKTMIAELDRIADSVGRSRSEIMTMCMEFAMEHMEVESKDHREG